MDVAGMGRRTFLQAMGVTGATLLAPAAVGAVERQRPLANDNGDGGHPQTGFEERGGESWTTHEEELEFLDAVAAGSSRVAVEEIGESVAGRPLHIVRLGAPNAPSVGHANQKPVLMHLGCQHGNEPAGREAVLSYLRDLAFTDDPTLVRQLEQQVFLINPTTNPDGRAGNQRTNGVMDINRDHLTLTQPETQAVHAVMRDWGPDVMIDHHEYGPSVPVLYDGEILYLWSRNLNVDPQVRDLARTLAEEYIGKGARQAGYTAGPYGIYRADQQPLLQTAGGPDEGISRNATGLRHTLGILIESAVQQSWQRPTELVDETENRWRRYESQYQTIMDTLRFMRDQGDLAKFASDGAADRAAHDGAEQSRPTYWGGADNEEPSDGDIDDPPACRYELSGEQLDEVAAALVLHGIGRRPAPGSDDRWRVEMGQAGRPVIPLLLDGRGSRSAVAADADYCD